MSAPMFVALDDKTWVQVDKIIAVREPAQMGVLLDGTNHPVFDGLNHQVSVLLDGLNYPLFLAHGVTAKDFLNRIESVR